MAKKKKRKTYALGDVVTARLTPDSGCTQDVLDWINKSEMVSHDIIDAIKLKIAAERNMSGKVIKDIVAYQVADEVHRPQREAYMQESKPIYTTVPLRPNLAESRPYSDVNYQEVKVVNEEPKHGAAIVEEVFSDKVVEGSSNPGLKALRSLRKG